MEQNRKKVLISGILFLTISVFEAATMAIGMIEDYLPTFGELFYTASSGVIGVMLLKNKKSFELVYAVGLLACVYMFDFFDWFWFYKDPDTKFYEVLLRQTAALACALTLICIVLLILSDIAFGYGKFKNSCVIINKIFPFAFIVFAICNIVDLALFLRDTIKYIEYYENIFFYFVSPIFYLALPIPATLFLKIGVCPSHKK